MEHLDDAGSEFPRIDDRLAGRHNRHIAVAGVSGGHQLVRGERDRLVRYDMGTGTSESYDRDGVIGEVVFAPRREVRRNWMAAI